MKNLKCVALVFAVLSLCACHEIRLRESHNGLVDSTLSADITPFSADVSIDRRAVPAMDKCVSDIGAMENGEEQSLCAGRMRADEARRARRLDHPVYQYYQPYPYQGQYPYTYPSQPVYVVR